MDDALWPKTAFGEDWSMPTIRMLHGTNMYWSSALGYCAVTLSFVLDLVDACDECVIESGVSVTITARMTGGTSPRRTAAWLTWS